MGVRGGREADLVRGVPDLLTLRGVRAWRANAGSTPVGTGPRRRCVRLGPAGLPDVLAVLPPAGRLCGIEVKRKDGRVRPAQRAFLDNLAAAGGLALVVRDLRELQVALDALDALV